MAEMYKLGLGHFEERRDTGRWLGTGEELGHHPGFRLWVLGKLEWRYVHALHL